MAFTKSPYQLSRVQSLRVETSFPARLAEASKRAGVPNGVLLSRLVDQYLESKGDDEGLTAIAKLAQTREIVRDLGRVLGVGITIEQLNVAMADGVYSLDEARVAGVADPGTTWNNPDAPPATHVIECTGSDPDSDPTDSDDQDGFWNGTGTEGD